MQKGTKDRQLREKRKRVHARKAADTKRRKVIRNPWIWSTMMNLMMRRRGITKTQRKRDNNIRKLRKIRKNLKMRIEKKMVKRVTKKMKKNKTRRRMMKKKEMKIMTRKTEMIMMKMRKRMKKRKTWWRKKKENSMIL